MGYDICVNNSNGHCTITCFGFVDVLSQNCTEMVGKWYRSRRVSSHIKWKLYGACAMSIRNPYDF